jgi:hypothetical protein
MLNGVLFAVDLVAAMTVVVALVVVFANCYYRFALFEFVL